MLSILLPKTQSLFEPSQTILFSSTSIMTSQLFRPTTSLAVSRVQISFPHPANQGRAHRNHTRSVTPDRNSPRPRETV